ncbi:MAG: YtxH domain-containing protein [Fimbriimonadales bacterium]
MSDNNDKNVMLYFLAGVGLGALIGAAAGLLLAPKSGAETREDLSKKFDDLKGKVTNWIKTRKEEGKAIVGGVSSSDEVGA